MRLLEHDRQEKTGPCSSGDRHLKKTMPHRGEPSGITLRSLQHDDYILLQRHITELHVFSAQIALAINGLLGIFEDNQLLEALLQMLGMFPHRLL